MRSGNAEDSAHVNADVFHGAEPFVDVLRAAEFLSLRPRRVLELVRAGMLPAYPLGSGKRRRWRFRLSELAAALLEARIDSSHAAVRARKGKK